ncbi:MAG TPA: hypothetical protein VF816_15230 [Rhodocyclaceae bacterium]
MPACRCALLAAVLAVSFAPAAAYPWGATGHRLVTTVAIENLPPDLPAFLKAPGTLASLGELAREPDRSKGAGTSHDHDLDPGHYLDLGDSGLIGDGLPLDPLPPDREAYDSALRRLGLTEYRAGYLPYSIIDGWQQVRKDFAYWRATVAAARGADTAEARRWFDEDRRLREMILLRDIGYWSHFVADGSQPMHVSVHYNGWMDYPNPDGYTQARGIHARFEGRYVAEHVDHETLVASLQPPQDLGCGIEAWTAGYLRETNREIVPLYRLEKSGAFDDAGTAGGTGFAAARLAAGAAAIRDLVAAAWRCSADDKVGYPPVDVKEIDAGRVVPLEALRGRD